MNGVFSNNKFFFNKIRFKKEHYTDNRQGTSCHYLARLEKGQCKIVAKSITLELFEGDVFYIPINFSYQSYWYGEEEIVFNSLGFVSFPEGESQGFELQRIECSNELKAKIDAVPLEKITSQALGAFYSVLGEVVPLMKQSRANQCQTLYKKVLNCMYESPKSTIQEIAESLHVCESSIYTAFKKASGKAPNAVKQEILCEKAISLLSTTDKPIQEISDDLGFSSSSYFRKVLKAVTKASPRDIRKKRLF